MIGATNVFSDIDGWKPATRESLLAKNPDYIVITERGLKAQGGMAGLEKNPVLRLTSAVKEKNVYALDGMALLGFGPRTLETAISLSEKLK
jgi:iron complex transport system substrate-binding protein